MQLTIERALSLQHAIELRNQGCHPLSGATDIYPSMLPRLGKMSSERRTYVDLSSVPELSAVRLTRDCLELGASATWTAISKAALPRSCLALQQAAVEIGSVQIQNQATIGGNICNASPAADGIPVLFALDAVVVLRSKASLRKLPITKFVLGNRSTALRADELLTAIEIPLPRDPSSSRFAKIGGRKYLIISIASAAVRLECSAGVITGAAISVGACSAVPSRIEALEASLIGRKIEPYLPLKIDATWLAQLKPIDDVRATKAFRFDAASVLVGRTLLACLADLAAVADSRE